MWQSSKTFEETKNSNCDKTKKKQIATKFKKIYCGKKIKLWQTPKIQIVTKLKNSDCDGSKPLDNFTMGDWVTDSLT